MMPYEMMTKDVFRDVFAGKKNILKLKDVNFIHVDKYDELSVKNLYSRLVSLPEMA